MRQLGTEVLAVSRPIQLLIDVVAEDYPSLPTDKLAVLDVSGLHAFLMKVIKKSKLNLFLADVQAAMKDEELRFRANFMWDNIMEGKEGLWLDFHDEGVEKQVAYMVSYNKETNTGSVYGIAKWSADGRTELQQPDADDIQKQLDSDARLLLDSLLYFLTMPKTQIRTTRLGGNAARRSKHHSRPPVAGIKLVVIDGVSVIVRPDGTEEYKVKKGGWHNAHHFVRSHYRRGKNGQMVLVKSFERGDASLGEVRYRVNPSKVFLEGLGIQP